MSIQTSEMIATKIWEIARTEATEGRHRMVPTVSIQSLSNAIDKLVDQRVTDITDQVVEDRLTDARASMAAIHQGWKMREKELRAELKKVRASAEGMKKAAKKQRKQGYER